MTEQFIEKQWLESHTCWSCGVLYAMPKNLVYKRRSDGRSFYCPNGHGAVFRETTEAKLKRDLDRERQVREAAEARANTAESERLQVTKAHKKMRGRVMNGVCPCCNRTFTNLMNHMKSEHPEFAEVKTLNALRMAFAMTQAAVAKEAGVYSTHVSLYERGHHVTPYAKQRLERWLETHQAKATP